MGTYSGTAVHLCTGTKHCEKGDIIGPIRSGVGFHILKVNDMRGQSQSISVTEVHARHILLKPSPIMTDQQARLKLEQIAADIKSGKTTFAAAAKEFSQDHGSANPGRRSGLGGSGYFRSSLPRCADPTEQRSDERSGALLFWLAPDRTAGHA